MTLCKRFALGAVLLACVVLTEANRPRRYNTTYHPTTRPTTTSTTTTTTTTTEETSTTDNTITQITDDPGYPTDPPYYPTDPPTDASSVNSSALECFNSTVPARNISKLVVLVVGGLRDTYFPANQASMPTLASFIRRGAQAESLRPPFPSEALPSWYDLLSGRFVRNHDIVGNYFKRRNIPQRPDSIVSIDRFLATTNDSSLYQRAKPIWTSATFRDISTAVEGLFRPDVPVSGIRPAYAVPYPGGPDNNILTAQDNLAVAARELIPNNDFVMVYIGNVKESARRLGPDSVAMRGVLRELDNLLRRFFNDMRCNGVNPEDVNMIIMGDHGMVCTEGITRVSLAQNVDLPSIERILSFGAYMGIYTYPGLEDSVFNRLRPVAGVNVYRRRDIPASYNYRESFNAPDILVVARPGNYINPMASIKQEPFVANVPQFQVPAGISGYPPQLVDAMNAALYYAGPDVLPQCTAPSSSTVDVNPLMAYFLNIDPEPNDGSLANLGTCLVNPPELPDTTTTTTTTTTTRRPTARAQYAANRGNARNQRTNTNNRHPTG